MQVLGKTKKDVITEFRTAEILEAARQVFAEKGFEAATVEDIAERAGVAKGTVYLYYDSKRSIYLAALKGGIAELHKQQEAMLAGPQSVEQKIHDFIELGLAHFERNRDFMKIYLSEMGPALAHPASAGGELCNIYCKASKMLEPTLQEAQAANLIRPVPTDAVAFAILELTRGIMILRVMGWIKNTVEEATAFVFDLVWKGIANR